MTIAPSIAWRGAAAAWRAERLPTGLDALWHSGAGGISRLRHRTADLLAFADRVLEGETEAQGLSDSRLRSALGDARERFRLARDSDADHVRALTLVREAARRTLGVHAHREQVAGAAGLLRGCLVEMATGEGKTLTAALAAVPSAWRGLGVHVVTVNDYLAQRDALWMSPLYDWCGVRGASVTQNLPFAPRRDAYAADITHLTGRDAAADFLRDRLALGRAAGSAGSMIRAIAEGAGGAPALLQRGLACAIVDEADAVLIDEAVTPLILSGGSPAPGADRLILAAARAAASLREGPHFVADDARRDVILTAAGREAALRTLENAGGASTTPRRAEELVVQSLIAQRFYSRGQHYLVRDGAVVIVDESTGRLMPDRTWRDGLHQAVEAKESLEISPQRETLASLSFQRFFRLYRRLSGMSGTIAEAAGEAWRVYSLPTVRIPTHRPCIREQRPDRLFRSAASKWNAVVAAAQHEHAQGRPVLVGVRTVQASETMSERLTAAGLAHVVLNAERHAEEAAIIARAGEPGRITVATNMAGRGTDITLGHGVAARGGLHVIATERHESRRVDRQLFGRAGRQGDPGSAQAFVSAEDELLVRFGGPAARAFGSGDGEAGGRAARLAVALAQARAGADARRHRARVLRMDDWLDETIGVAAARH